MNKKVDHTNALVVTGVLLLTGFIFYIIGCFKDNETALETVSFQLKGSDTIQLYVDEVYKEPGFIADGSTSGKLNDYVSVKKDIKNYPGVYEIVYNLDFNGLRLQKVRKVKVVSKPIVSEGVNGGSEESGNDVTGENDGLKVDKTDRIKIKLKGYSHVYLLKGMTYHDEGVLAVTDSGKDVTDKVIKGGSVDTGKVGSYKLTYKVTDSSGKSASVKRVVDVLNMSLTAAVSTNQNTNQSVILKVTATADNFKHMIMPDGVKNKDYIGEYIVTKNGKYSFEVVNDYGLSTTYTYSITNIDKVAPEGSCSGYTTGKKSFITVSASDNLGISKYMIGNNSYTNSSIELNEVKPKPSITIYDVVGNTKTISCDLENRYSDF